MDPTARSERLLLRAWSPGDAARYFELCDDDEVARFYGWRPRDVAEVEGILRDFNGREAGLGVTTWAVCLDGSVIGSCGFARTNAAWMGAHVVEIGWLLGRTYWGQGFATEAAGLALRVAEGRIDPARIVSKCDARNVRSEAVMRRIGLVRVGLVAGGGTTTVVYRRLDHGPEA